MSETSADLLAQGAPLAVQWRGAHPESVHLGHLVIVSLDGELIASRGRPEVSIYARSALKPVQALPLVLSGAADAFGLRDACLAVAMASHSGEPGHVEAVSAMLAAAGLSVEQLQCGAHAPYHAESADALTRVGAVPSPLHCNCSGKHAAMLATCVHQGWDTTTYLSPEHPVQAWIRALLAELAELSPDAIDHAIDGCSAPAWRLPLRPLGRAFARLGTPDTLRPELKDAARRLSDVMGAHPDLIAGSGRLDTDLLRAGAGRLIGKIGGEGVHAGAVRGTGLGWAIKVADGNRRAIAPALARALAEAGHRLPADDALARHIAPDVRNNRGTWVGEIRPGW